MVIEMRMTGVQYYWLIAIGLLAGLVGPIVTTFVAPIETLSPAVVVVILLLTMYSAMAVLVVLLEIRDRFGLLLAILAVVVPPSIIIYWFTRINGYDDVATVR